VHQVHQKSLQTLFYIFWGYKTMKSTRCTMESILLAKFDAPDAPKPILQEVEAGASSRNLMHPNGVLMHPSDAPGASAARDY
jgi:hypothetical protein